MTDNALLAQQSGQDFVHSIVSTAILVPIVFFVVIAVLVLGGIYFRNQRERMWNETARLAIEKGQPIPDRSFNPINKFAGNEAAYLRWQVRRDVRIGLILLAAGIAAGVHLGLNQGWDIGSAGAIPGLIGVAFLLNAWINARSAAKIPNSDVASPRQ